MSEVTAALGVARGLTQTFQRSDVIEDMCQFSVAQLIPSDLLSYKTCLLIRHLITSSIHRGKALILSPGYGITTGDQNISFSLSLVISVSVLNGIFME